MHVYWNIHACWGFNKKQENNRNRHDVLGNVLGFYVCTGHTQWKLSPQRKLYDVCFHGILVVHKKSERGELNMNDALISAVASASVATITGFFGLMAARKKSSNTAETVDKRALLSEDESEFRTHLMQMMDKYQSQVDKLTVQYDELVASNKDLQNQVEQLTKDKEKLLRTVNELKKKNAELEREININKKTYLYKK